ncbi:MAG: AraC family transcriptional regulator [Treponema sp.]|nr:AraC family transcriptional regulator [Treponema sp.]
MSANIDEDMTLDIQHVIYRKCTPVWVMPENRLENINMTYVVQGDARYTVDDETIDVTQGDLLVLPRDSVRKAASFPDRLMHCFSVDFTLRNSMNEELLSPLPFLSSPGQHRNIIHWFHELSFSWMDKHPGYTIKCKGLFLQILYRFLELLVYKDRSFAGDFRITKVIRYIAKNYSERLTVKSMADMVGLNPTYFGDLFQRTAGMSFNRYLIQLRIKNAEEMLLSGEYRVGDAAEACGFTDTSHFYKQFKHLKGFPPSQCMPKSFDS